MTTVTVTKRLRRWASIVALLPLAVAAGLAQAPARGPDEPSDDVVARVHRAALTIDAHMDIGDDFQTPANDAGSETKGQLDLPKLERGGLDVATIALFATPQKRSPESVAAARKQIDAKLAAVHRFIDAHPDRLEQARSAADVEKIAASGKHAILLGFLNALSIGEDLSLIRTFRDQGVRVFGFVHAQNNAFADSSRPNASFGDRPDEAGGLTPLGKKAVAELNRLGVIVDVSQLTPNGVRQTLEITRAPVIASHSGIRARVNATRNLSNDELRAIARNGGVVHIVAFPAYLRSWSDSGPAFQQAVLDPLGLHPGDDPRAKLDAPTFEKYQRAYREYGTSVTRTASLVDWLDTVDYAVRLIGIDHVGLSSDFNHGGGVIGYANVGDGPNVTRELLKRGYSEEDIGKLWGRNFLRVLKEVEKVGARSPKS
jgi:microsomal dipeptidase-like Zn-dependent dipeptidase